MASSCHGALDETGEAASTDYKFPIKISLATIHGSAIFFTGREELNQEVLQPKLQPIVFGKAAQSIQQREQRHFGDSDL